jgi:hypothetical protein
MVINKAGIIRIKQNRINQESEERFLRFLDMSENPRATHKFFMDWLKNKSITVTTYGIVNPFVFVNLLTMQLAQK